MEYLAFILLGLGLLLVVSGLLLQTNREKSDAPRVPDFSNRPFTPAPRAMTESYPHESEERYHLPQSLAQTHVPEPERKAPVNFPGMLHFETQNAAPPEQPAAETERTVGVKISRENPKLFERFSYLYLDSSGKNTYISQGAGIDIRDVSGIRRFGRGLFSYDGFLFRFTHATGEERFPLNSLQFISFYPNCVALTPKNNLPVALLFMEETDSIRQILETFKVEHGAT